jgi:hypothetical protein
MGLRVDLRVVLLFDARPHPAVIGIPWDVALTLVLLAAAVLAVLLGGYALLKRWRRLPSLFLPRPVTVVH